MKENGAAVWVPASEVLQLLGCTARHLRRLELTSRESATRGRNGKPTREFKLSSLPADAQRKYLDGIGQSHGDEQTQSLPERVPTDSPLSLTPHSSDDSAAATASASAVQIASRERIALPSALDAEAIRRAAIIKPLLDYLRDPASDPTAANSNQLAERIAKENGISASTVWRWKSRFDREGRFALARKPRVDKNRSAWAAQHADLADLAALIYMGTPEQPAQSVRVAWEAVCDRALNLDIAAPSYETVRAYLRNEVNASMLTYNRRGRKAYDAQFAPYMSRGYTEPANSIWVSDHMIHDVLVQNDLFGERDLKHMRLQMTTLLDYRSRFVVGVSWCQNGSSHSIKRALLRAFTRYGLPDRFYCDNGNDYRKVAKNARPRDFEAMAEAGRAARAELQELSTGVMQRLGIPVTFCTPFHPQAKHIERYHGTVHERFDKRFITYTAGAPHLRPDAATASLARHGKLLQMGRAAESTLPLASDFIAMCEWWIENEYHQRRQPDSKGMDGRSPAEVFEQERGATRPCPEIAVLAMLLCERAQRKVMNCAVEIQGARFVPALTDHEANLQMHERSGRRVTVAFDPVEPQYVAVLDDELRFVCRLEREDLMRFSDDEQTRGQVQSFIANRNALRKAVRESTAALGKRVRAAGGFITLEDQLRERAALPAAVGEITPTLRKPVEDESFKTHHSEDNVDWFFQNAGGANGAL